MAMVVTKIMSFFKKAVSPSDGETRAVYDPSGTSLIVAALVFLIASASASFQVGAVGLIAGRALSVLGAALLLKAAVKPLAPRDGSYTGACFLLLGVALENVSRLFTVPLSSLSHFSIAAAVSSLLLYLVLPRYRDSLRAITGAGAFVYCLTISTAVSKSFSAPAILFPFATSLLPSLMLAAYMYTADAKAFPRVGSNKALYALAFFSVPSYAYLSAAGYLAGETDGLSLLYRTLPVFSLLLVAPCILVYLLNRGNADASALLRPLTVFVLALAVLVPSAASVRFRDIAGVETSYEYAKRSATNLLATGSVDAMTADKGAGPRDFYRGLSFEDCDRQNARDCFITYYDTMAMRYGVIHAVKDIIDKVKNNKGTNFPSHCHQTVHNLGQMAYTVAKTFADAAAIDPQVCGTGYTHGLWEQKFVEIGNKEMFDNTGSLCTELNMVSPWYKWTCHHILGHIMSQTLSMDPATAAAYCTKVTDPQALTDCLTGAWMNFFQDDVVIEKMRKDGDMLNLFGVCYGAPQSTKFFCYQELFPVIYAMVGGSDYEASQACLTYAEPSRGTGDPWLLTSENYADRCVQGLARGLSASSAIDYRLIATRCRDMLPGAQDPCLTAGAASVVLNTGSTTAAFEVCAAVSDQAYREYCYFWSKHARTLLANGPNDFNLPQEGEIRVPETPKKDN